MAGEKGVANDLWPVVREEDDTQRGLQRHSVCIHYCRAPHRRFYFIWLFNLLLKFTVNIKNH